MFSGSIFPLVLLHFTKCHKLMALGFVVYVYMYISVYIVTYIISYLMKKSQCFSIQPACHIPFTITVVIYILLSYVRFKKAHT